MVNELTTPDSKAAAFKNMIGDNCRIPLTLLDCYCWKPSND